MAFTNLLDTEMSAEATYDLLGESEPGFQLGVPLFYLGDFGDISFSSGH